MYFSAVQGVFTVLCMTTAAHAHSLPSPHSIPSPLRPPDLTSCNFRRCSSCRCSNVLRTPLFEPPRQPAAIDAITARRGRRAQERSSNDRPRRRRCRGTTPLPLNLPMSVQSEWLGERCERRQRQQQPHRPRARKRARNHQAGRSTPPASSAELLAARCGSSSSCSRAPRHRRESQKLADGCARALRALKFAR